MSEADIIRYIRMQKYDPKPFCNQCRNRATVEVLFEMEDHFLMHRFCSECLIDAGYKLPSS